MITLAKIIDNKEALKSIFRAAELLEMKTIEFSLVESLPIDNEEEQALPLILLVTFDQNEASEKNTISYDNYDEGARCVILEVCIKEAFHCDVEVIDKNTIGILEPTYKNKIDFGLDISHEAIEKTLQKKSNAIEFTSRLPRDRHVKLKNRVLQEFEGVSKSIQQKQSIALSTQTIFSKLSSGDQEAKKRPFNHVNGDSMNSEKDTGNHTNGKSQRR